MTLTSFRDQLLRRRSELLARYRGELERADELDKSEPEEVERSAEHWDVQVLSRLGDADARAIADVVAALRRLDTGNYGTCVVCKSPIGTARLAAIPEASRCVECARPALGL
jgi:DnaK suppressor protein